MFIPIVAVLFEPVVPSKGLQYSEDLMGML